MEFNINVFMQRIEEYLKPMTMRHRLAFAAWCADWLFNKSKKFTQTCLGTGAVDAIRQAIDWSWTVVGGISVDDENGEQLRRAVESIVWDDSEIVDNDKVLEMYLTETVDCVLCALDIARADRPNMPSQAAECIVNALDFELGFIYGRNYSEEVFQDPRMVTVLRSIDDLLQVLLNADLERTELIRVFK